MQLGAASTNGHNFPSVATSQDIDSPLSFPFTSLRVGTDILSLSAHGIVPPHLEERLSKHWARAFGLGSEETIQFLGASAADHLRPFLEFDRMLRLAAGTLRVSFDTERGFRSALLTGETQRSTSGAVANRILSAEFLNGLSGADLLQQLASDPDRLSKNSARVSSERRALETLRAVREEVIPILISGIFGELGVPIQRGSRGFDLLCSGIAGMSSQDIAIHSEDVQVKILYKDSPIFNRDSVSGKRQFFKLIAILTGAPPQGTANRALLIQGDASAEQMQELATDLSAAGAQREQIIILESERLRLSGIDISELGRLQPRPRTSTVTVNVDLQQFLKFSWAQKLASGGPPVFPSAPALQAYSKTPYVLPGTRLNEQEPVEIALLRANGCYEILEYLLAKS
jgi:hypothetical protein